MSILFLAFCVNSAFANEFSVQSFDKIDNDVSARRFTRTDVNDIECAIIKIRTDIPAPFFFDANLGLEGNVEYKTNNEIWLYVSEGERQLTIAKDEFVTLKYNLPEGIVRSTVYSLVLRRKDNMTTVILISDPKDAEKYIDGEGLGSGNSFQIEKGNHLLELKKAAYHTYSKNIFVNKDNAVFDGLVLSPLEPVMLSFNTKPSGATIFINNVEEGITNIQLFHFPGKYDLRISKSNYEVIEESIIVSSEDDNTWEYELVKTTGTLKIISTPSDAETLVNGKFVSDKNVELAPGQYRIEVRAKGWISESRNIIVEKGSDQTQSFLLTQIVGALQLVVKPSETNVIMRAGSQRVDSWRGSGYKKGVPVGNYTLELSLNGYVTQEKSLKITENKTTNLSVSLELNSNAKDPIIKLPAERKNTVTDIDGNSYRTIKIGANVWMAENLKVSHYRNGDAINHLSDKDLWKKTYSGAYCFYDNDLRNGQIYGALYNWYAVGDSRGLAPEGWHVATDADWKELEMYLGMPTYEANDTGLRGTIEGSMLKESGTLHWKSSSAGGTNDVGFSVLPGGSRSYKSGIFHTMQTYGYFWTGTEGGSERAWDRKFYYGGSDISRGKNLKRLGYSVRCVKD